ncbi:MAG TPA: aminotransferase class I/II-fold pyridoxal phosphate-dependent enzyme [Candidatus Anaerobutyricum faecale]|nr:aminotransferase class I/II-fold pyridoxal phosphate-dependent enzyme [Candidatus Anaerobutyricum faecale]
MKNSTHGGNIYKKAKELGISENQILDYSANISPLGIPSHIKKAMVDAIEGTINYPDPDCTALREAIGRQDGVEPDCVTCGNGGADLLYRLAFGLKPKKVLLPVPAFVEYEEAMTAAGARMVYETMDEDFHIREDMTERITENTDLVILCNPNNPTGLLTPRRQVLAVLERAKEMHCRVLVDECFLEICREEEQYTVKPYLKEYPNLMILKSFTKLYAIPGVRLGYLLCADREVIAQVNRAGQAWSVSHIAQCAGVAALSHPEYKAAVIDAVEKELIYMKKEMANLPLTLYDGRANYLFFRTPGVTDLDRRLESRGIMIRNCSNYVNLGNDYWRIAVKTHEENVILLQELRQALRQ